MDVEKKFFEASENVKKLKKSPSQDQLLLLYSFYKQATQGDVKGERPGMINFKERAKFDAWAKTKGLSIQDAQKKYINLVEQLMAGSS